MKTNQLRPLDLLYLECFPAFVEAAFQIVYPGQKLHDSWHIRAVSWQLQEMYQGRSPRWLILNMPPRSLKTFIVAICYPAWCIIRNPAISIIVASYGDDLSKKVGRQFRALMESDFVIRLSKGNLANALKSSETEYETPQRGGRFATSAGGVITGRGADILIVDDPIKADEAYSEAARRTCRKWFMEAAHSRQNRPGGAQIIISMQRLHVDDLSGTLIEAGWPAMALPAIATEEAEYDLGGGLRHHRKAGDFLQDGWDRLDHFESIKSTAGTHIFSAQYQQRPLPAEGSMVKRAWMQPYKLAPALEEYRHIYVACDPSGAAGAHNDFTAIVVAGVKDRTVYVLESIRGHWECMEICRRLQSAADRWQSTQMIIETTGQGESARQEIARAGRFPVRGVTPKLSKDARLSRVIGRLGDGRVRLPMEADWLADFDAELFGFPNFRYDDQVDALIMILEDLAEREASEQDLTGITLWSGERDDPWDFDQFTNTGSYW